MDKIITIKTTSEFAKTMHFAYTIDMTTNVQIRIDTALKNKAEKTLNKLGLDLPTAFRIFLNKVNLVGGIPFSVTDDNYFIYSNKEEEEILDAYKNSPRSKKFNNSKELIKFLRA
ncbi:type II toxin-antitoxin system RelB/DinJ family antitoxin [Arenimonas sp.]|nr:type II toxin-antitoxin system RelB/DinJ family antitoxin [Candidatus Parcubacteria bacterium]